MTDHRPALKLSHEELQDIRATLDAADDAMCKALGALTERLSSLRDAQRTAHRIQLRLKLITDDTDETDEANL
jgi:hypothetical protein